MTGPEDGAPLREQLLDLVPPAPQVPDRGHAVRRRAAQLRRRRAGATVAATLATAAVVGAVVGGAGLVDPIRDDEVEPVAPTPYTAAPCPATPAEPDAGADLPDGAVAVRLCAADGSTVPVPDDALVTDVDGFVAELGRLQELPPDAVCTADAGPAYVLQVQLGDGTVRQLRGELYGCTALRLSSAVARSGADEALATFTTRLRRQREELQPPGAGRAPDCAFRMPEGVPSVGSLGQAERAVFCPTGKGAPVVVRPKDLAVLVEAWRRSDGRIGRHGGCGGRVEHLVAVTTWNDLVRVEVPCGLWFGHGLQIGRSGPAAQAVLDRLRADRGSAGGGDTGDSAPPAGEAGDAGADPGTGGGGGRPGPGRTPPATQPTDPSTGPTDPSGSATGDPTGSADPSGGTSTGAHASEGVR